MLIYPDLRQNQTEPSGGYVEMHLTHASQEAVRNIETAIFLAQLGFKVRLLAISHEPGVKNPDAYLIEEQLIIEFKHNSTPTASAIENELRDAKRQADYVLLHIKSTISREDLIKGLRRQIHRAENVKEVWIIYGQVLSRLTPEEIRDKNAEAKIQ
ncbi:hypothetical protein AWR27_01490 [Spirosoma montaniterrae]|uniref:tRNA nuclease CdiA C-terminal domain-containing protein n=1 Tax=Spirosoma montaniterrae TaxID=1178516 RepID=A0A1P9X3Q4_9BACT|nr:hypothetical protein AWR27_01490 [Spirosoma montaniterrae]